MYEVRIRRYAHSVTNEGLIMYMIDLNDRLVFENMWKRRDKRNSTHCEKLRVIIVSFISFWSIDDQNKTGFESISGIKSVNNRENNTKIKRTRDTKYTDNMSTLF